MRSGVPANYRPAGRLWRVCAVFEGWLVFARRSIVKSKKGFSHVCFFSDAPAPALSENWLIERL
jgi:hypothetical protein